MKRVLVTGAVGQIGSELTVRLRKLLGGHLFVAIFGGSFHLADRRHI
jgi:uncharacterized protein YbjT (DUF2867 family)